MEPEKPHSSDCCSNGCSPCVFDIYEQRLKSWRENLRANYNEDTLCRRDLLSETRFKPFQLIQKEQLTEDVYFYHFQPLTGSTSDNEIFGFLPYQIGQHLILRCSYYSDTGNGSVEKLNSNIQTNESLNGEESTSDIGIQAERIITRAYTPVTLSKQAKNCSFSIFAKLYRNGVASEYLQRLQVRDICYWRGPYGEFQYQPNKFKWILMFCIGSGLAPMISIIEYILSNNCDDTILHLSYGVRNIKHVILRDILRRMTQYWNFTLQYFFSEDNFENNNMKFGENYKNKRIDKLSINELIAGKDLNGLLVLVCGTYSFTSSIKSSVSELGVDSQSIFIF